MIEQLNKIADIHKVCKFLYTRKVIVFVNFIQKTTTLNEIN